jgi:hypothetical protein
MMLYSVCYVQSGWVLFGRGVEVPFCHNEWSSGISLPEWWICFHYVFMENPCWYGVSFFVCWTCISPIGLQIDNLWQCKICSCYQFFCWLYVCLVERVCPTIIFLTTFQTLDHNWICVHCLIWGFQWDCLQTIELSYLNIIVCYHGLLWVVWSLLQKLLSILQMPCFCLCKDKVVCLVF